MPLLQLNCRWLLVVSFVIFGYFCEEKWSVINVLLHHHFWSLNLSQPQALLIVK